MTDRKIVTSIQSDGVKFVVNCEKFIPKSNVTSQDILAGAALDNGSDAEGGDLDNQIQDMNTNTNTTENKSPKRRKTQHEHTTSNKPATTTPSSPPPPQERRTFTESQGVIKMTELERFSGGPVDIIGVDPGVTDMFAVVDSENHHSKLTKKRYNTVIGIKGNSRKLENWAHSSSGSITTKQNSISTSSVSTLDDYKQHVTCFYEVANDLHDFYGAKRITRMRLSNYIRRDKLLDNFINQVFLDKGPPASTLGKKAAKRARRRHNQKVRRAASGLPSPPPPPSPPPSI